MMGVYHLMGLGCSVGAVTGPVSYLTHQYVQNQAFFHRSGEAKQREEGKKVGDIQAIILSAPSERARCPHSNAYFNSIAP